MSSHKKNNTVIITRGFFILATLRKHRCWRQTSLSSSEYVYALVSIFMSFSFGLVHRERQRLRVWAKKVKTGQLVSHCSRHLCLCHRVHVLRPYPAMFFPCSKSTISCVRSKISCFFISKISSFRKQKIMLWMQRGQACSGGSNWGLELRQSRVSQFR